MQLLLGHHLDVPPDQLRCQADILAPFADGQRELIFVDQDEDFSDRGRRTDDHVVNHSRLHSVGDQDRQRFVPTYDVDPLASQLLDNVLDPRTPHSDTGSDTVDVVVVTRHGHLGSVAGLASQRLDLDDRLGYFRDFTLKKPLHQVRVLSRQDDLDPTARLADFDDHRPHSLVDTVRFARDLLAPRQKRLDLAQVYRGSSAVESRHRARDHRTPQLLVLDVQRVPLGLAKLLDHHLFGGLRRNAAEDGAEVIRSNIDARTLYCRFARHPVDMHLDLRLLTIVPAGRRQDRLLDPFEYDTLVDILVAVDRVNQPEKFGSVHYIGVPPPA